MVIWMIRTYSELITLPTFEERYNYLKLSANVGEETFGFDRVFNQKFYTSLEWKRVRDKIIIRDNGCDLGIEERPIPNGVPIYIHHINPILLKDIQDRTEILLNPEFLICTTFRTHQAIHYGDVGSVVRDLTERTKFDTCPWRRS